MSAFTDSIKEWFGFTRRERRSTFILLIIILVIIGFRFIVPESGIVISDIPVPDTGSIRDTLTAVRKEPYTRKKTGSRMPPRQNAIIDINNCDSSRLVTLPGIGPVLSARIIKYRNLLGGYASVNQLKEVYGLPGETFDMILPLVTADSSDVIRIKINKADFKELLRHPYLEKSDVSAIMKYRELEGSIGGINDLIVHKLITEEKALKVLPYLDYGK